MIDKLRDELMPLADGLQDAGVRGLAMLGKLPYGGLQWRYRALQRDPFIVSLFQTLPSECGTFKRVDALLAQKRLVYHSDALDLDLSFRRRGSTTAFTSSTADDAAQYPIPFPDFELPPTERGSRRAAAIWDLPPYDESHAAVGPLKVLVRLAQRGAKLDENRWEGTGFLLQSEAEEMLPTQQAYDPAALDWNVETERPAQ